MTEPTNQEQYLNIADQCTTTATNDLTASILVDGGSGTLRQLLNDAADAIRAGWAIPQPTQADSQPARDEIVRLAREQGLPETEIEGVFRVNADDLCRVVAAARAARAPADSMTAPAGVEVAGWLPVHFNKHGFYGTPFKTEAEAKQYINQVHQSSDSVTLVARPFTWIATPPAQAADSMPKASFEQKDQ